MQENEIKLLIGKWNFIRNITDNKANLNRHCIGTLEITKTKWFEQGQMNGNDFFQSYKLNMENDFTVLFNDDKLFYKIKDINKKQNIYHLCGGDEYNGIWELNNNNVLNLSWIVKGARKDYIMETRYTR